MPKTDSYPDDQGGSPGGRGDPSITPPNPPPIGLYHILLKVGSITRELESLTVMVQQLQQQQLTTTNNNTTTQQQPTTYDNGLSWSDYVRARWPTHKHYLEWRRDKSPFTIRDIYTAQTGETARSSELEKMISSFYNNGHGVPG